MKAVLYLFIFCYCLAFCQEPPPQSKIGKILQIAGVTDTSSNCLCDPYIGAVTLGTIACCYCGVPISAACPASSCAITTAIIYGSPILQNEALLEYVVHTNFCGARITRTTINALFQISRIQQQISYSPPTTFVNSLANKSKTE